MKRLFSLIFCVALLLSCSFCFTWGAETLVAVFDDDPFSSFYLSLDTEQLITSEDAVAIRKAFSDEFSYMQTQTGFQISDSGISDAELNAIKSCAVKFLGSNQYRFNALLEEISQVSFTNAVALFNNRVPSRAHPGQTEMRNYERVAVVSYDALKGKYCKQVARGTTVLTSSTITVEVDAMLRGYPITVGISYGETRTVTGPDYNYPLGDSGLYASHAAVFHILFGTIDRVTYDLYDSYTGEMIKSVEAYHVGNAHDNLSVFLMYDGSPVVLQHLGSDTCTNFTTFNNMKNAVETYPYRYV